MLLVECEITEKKKRRQRTKRWNNVHRNSIVLLWLMSGYQTSFLFSLSLCPQIKQHYQDINNNNNNVKHNIFIDPFLVYPVFIFELCSMNGFAIVLMYLPVFFFCAQFELYLCDDHHLPAPLTPLTCSQCLDLTLCVLFICLCCHCPLFVIYLYLYLSLTHTLYLSLSM